MAWRSLLTILAASLFFAANGKAQAIGRIDCARPGEYVYLYSSLTTMDVRATVQCGDQVKVIGRYNNSTYLAVETAKGQAGFIPASSVVLLKDKDGQLVPWSQKPASRNSFYDDPATASGAAQNDGSSPEFTLKNNTPVKVKTLVALTSSSSKVNDKVDLEVLQDVLVDGMVVIAKGAPVAGTVTDVESKKRMGHGGVVGVSVNLVQLSNKETAAVRGYHEAKGEDSQTATVLPMLSGKDVAMPEGTEFTVSIDGDVKLKRASFAAAAVVKDLATGTVAAGPAQDANAPH